MLPAAYGHEVKEEDFVDTMDMDGDENAEGNMDHDPIDGLLDLDIISFDENDMAFSFDVVDDKEQARTAGCGPELQACCFSYFDWGCSSANANPQSNQPQRTGYMCGLEAWSSRSTQQQQAPQSMHYAQDAMQQQYQQQQQNQYPQYQQQQQPQQPQQQMSYNNYGDIPYAPQQPIMQHQQQPPQQQQQQQYQMPAAPTHYPSVDHASYQVKQEPYIT